jgi:hypothetical protein
LLQYRDDLEAIWDALMNNQSITDPTQMLDIKKEILSKDLTMSLEQFVNFW